MNGIARIAAALYAALDLGWVLSPPWVYCFWSVEFIIFRFGKDYSENYEAIPEKAKKTMCGDWQECINEFTIRAITTHLAFLESDSLGAAWHDKETGRGVVNWDALMDKIQFYQQHREDYPTFESFYPQMLEVFE